MNYVPSSLEAAFSDPNLTVLLGVLITHFVYGLLFALALLILQIIADWFIFRKAGTGGWKALIPVYRDYTYYKIAWKGKYFFLMLLFCILGAAITSLSGRLPEYELWFSIAELICAIVVIVIEIKSVVKLAKVFGKRGGFAVGLIFLPIIFTCILGFGKAKYRRGKRRRKQKALPATENT